MTGGVKEYVACSKVFLQFFNFGTFFSFVDIGNIHTAWMLFFDNVGENTNH